MRIQGDLASNLTTDWREQEGDIQVGTSSAGSDQSIVTCCRQLLSTSDEEVGAFEG